METTVKILGNDYPVKFGLSVVKKFAVHKGFKSLDEFEEWYTKVDPKSLEILDDVAVLYLMGIQRGCKKEKVECDIDADDILDMVQEDPDEFGKLQEILQDAIVSEQPDTKEQPATTKKQPEKKH